MSQVSGSNPSGGSGSKLQFGLEITSLSHLRFDLILFSNIVLLVQLTLKNNNPYCLCTLVKFIRHLVFTILEVLTTQTI